MPAGSYGYQGLRPNSPINWRQDWDYMFNMLGVPAGQRPQTTGAMAEALRGGTGYGSHGWGFNDTGQNVRLTLGNQYMGDIPYTSFQGSPGETPAAPAAKQAGPGEGLPDVLPGGEIPPGSAIPPPATYPTPTGIPINAGNYTIQPGTEDELARMLGQIMVPAGQFEPGSGTIEALLNNLGTVEVPGSQFQPGPTVRQDLLNQIGSFGGKDILDLFNLQGLDKMLLDKLGPIRPGIENFDISRIPGDIRSALQGPGAIQLGTGNFAMPSHADLISLLTEGGRRRLALSPGDFEMPTREGLQARLPTDVFRPLQVDLDTLEGRMGRLGGNIPMDLLAPTERGVTGLEDRLRFLGGQIPTDLLGPTETDIGNLEDRLGLLGGKIPLDLLAPTERDVGTLEGRLGRLGSQISPYLLAPTETDVGNLEQRLGLLGERIPTDLLGPTGQDLTGIEDRLGKLTTGEKFIPELGTSLNLLEKIVPRLDELGQKRPTDLLADLQTGLERTGDLEKGLGGLGLDVDKIFQPAGERLGGLEERLKRLPTQISPYLLAPTETQLGGLEKRLGDLAVPPTLLPEIRTGGNLAERIQRVLGEIGQPTELLENLGAGLGRTQELGAGLQNVENELTGLTERFRGLPGLLGPTEERMTGLEDRLRSMGLDTEQIPGLTDALGKIGGDITRFTGLFGENPLESIRQGVADEMYGREPWQNLAEDVDWLVGATDYYGQQGGGAGGAQAAQAGGDLTDEAYRRLMEELANIQQNQTNQAAATGDQGDFIANLEAVLREAMNAPQTAEELRQDPQTASLLADLEELQRQQTMEMTNRLNRLGVLRSGDMARMAPELESLQRREELATLAGAAGRADQRRQGAMGQGVSLAGPLLADRQASRDRQMDMIGAMIAALDPNLKLSDSDKRQRALAQAMLMMADLPPDQLALFKDLFTSAPGDIFTPPSTPPPSPYPRRPPRGR